MRHCLLILCAWLMLAGSAWAQGLPGPILHPGGGGTSTTTGNATGLTFGFTSIPNTSTAPIAGQCVEYNGVGFTGAPCSSTGGYPSGNSPQIAGFSGLNASEGESVVGDCTFARSGANQYVITCPKTNSVPFGALATLNVGNGLLSGGGNLALVTPVLASNGGSGVTSPTAHAVLIGEGSAAFIQLGMAADTVLQGTGVGSDPQAAALTSCASGAMTYNTSTHAFGCSVLGTLATLGVGSGLTSSGGNLTLTSPVTTALGGTGISSPTAHDIMITEGSSAVTLLNLAADTILQGTAGDPQAGALLSCSTSSSALTYNTSTHVFGCNTISGSGTVNTGVQGQYAYYPASSTAVSPVGGIRVACGFAGATADVQMNNAIAALPNGGRIDANCYGFSTQTVAAEVLLPNNIPFTLFIDKATTFNTTINNPLKSTFHLQGQSTLKGDGVTGVAGGFGITLANGASVLSEIYMDGSGGGVDNSVENIGINGNSAATVAKGLLYAYQIGNIANISGVQSTANGSPLMMNVLDTVGPLALINDYMDCGSVAGTCTPLQISNDGVAIGPFETLIQGGVYAHEGAGGDCSEIDILDLGHANVTAGIIDGVTLESAHTCAIGVNMQRATDWQIRSSGCSAAGANGNTCFKISGVSNNISIQNSVMYNAWTNFILNTAVTPNVTIPTASTTDMGYYLWQGFSQPNAWRVDMGNNKSVSIDSTAMKVNGVSLTSATAAGISGGGALATGSNAFAGRITGLAATGNILTPGFTCTNAVTCSFEDDTTLGGVKVTAQGTTTITFSATNADTADYICSCR